MEKILQTTRLRASKSTLRVSRDNTRGEISLDFLRFYFFSRFKRPICKCRVPRNSWVCLTVSSRRHFPRSISLFVIDNLATRREKKKKKTYSKVVYLLIFTSTLELHLLLHPSDFLLHSLFLFFLSISLNFE